MPNPLYDHVVAAFTARTGEAPQYVVQAPGRVNLIGEHTDYTDGFVMPCAIDYQTIVAASPRADRRVRVVALDMGGAVDEFDLDQPIVVSARQPWVNYVRGMVAALVADGYNLCGANLVVGGNVPQGAGLSSSASLEVAIGQSFKEMCALQPLTQTMLALLAQRAENEFVGCKCGIMDQFVSANGRADHALLLDCQSLTATQIALPDNVAVLIVNSEVKRGLVESEYNARRVQCEAAARHFGVGKLRNVAMSDLDADASLDRTLMRRARHVVSENARTLAAGGALARSDWSEIGCLMRASHASMRDDFEITIPPIDHIVALLESVSGGAGGARMTGGGFGGCVVAMMPQNLVADARRALSDGYRSPAGKIATIYVCRASGGAGRL